jgi:hypothetical protein
MKTVNQFILRSSTSLLLGTMLSTMSSCAPSESTAIREIATQAMREQADQNQRIADATRNLVSADARAREEVVTTHARLQQQLQDERANLDQQKSQLSQLRESIELDRRRAPVIAESIRVFGGILVCLCPLVLAAYVLYSVNRISTSDEEQIVNEILIGELTSETPRLRLPEDSLVITDQRSPESGDTAESEPPF